MKSDLTKGKFLVTSSAIDWDAKVKYQEALAKALKGYHATGYDKNIPIEVFEKEIADMYYSLSVNEGSKNAYYKLNYKRRLAALNFCNSINTVN